MGTNIGLGISEAIRTFAESAQQGLVTVPGKELANPFAGGQGPLAPGVLQTHTKPKLRFLSPQDAAMQRALSLFQGQQDIRGQQGGGAMEALKLELLEQRVAKGRRGGGSSRRITPSNTPSKNTGSILDRIRAARNIS